MPNSLLNPLSYTLTPWLLLPLVVGFLIGRFPKFDVIWRSSTTYLHEMSHALVAILLGRKVNRIKVRLWFGGHTDYVGPRGAGNITVSWAGYAAPGLITLLVVIGVLTGYLPLIAWPFALSGWLALLLHRTFIGAIHSVVIPTLTLAIALSFINPWTQVAAYLLLGIALGHGVLSVSRLTEIRLSTLQPGAYDKEAADSEFLERWTRIPAIVWERSWTIFLYIAFVALIVVIFI